MAVFFVGYAILRSLFNLNCIVNGVYELSGRLWVYSHKFSPDNIPSWGDIRKVSGD